MLGHSPSKANGSGESQIRKYLRHAHKYLVTEELALTAHEAERPRPTLPSVGGKPVCIGAARGNAMLQARSPRLIAGPAAGSFDSHSVCAVQKPSTQRKDGFEHDDPRPASRSLSNRTPRSSAPWPAPAAPAGRRQRCPSSPCDRRPRRHSSRPADGTRRCPAKRQSSV